MKNTVAIISKELSAYSDFPPPVEHAIYRHNIHLEEYLCMYADNFGLRKHIFVNTKVLQITESDDHDVSGQWCVTVKNVREDKITSEKFDAVLVCTGVFAKSVLPDFSGCHKFQGRILHTHEYKTSEGFEGKTTVVVGIGNSAVDAAVDISDIAKQVYISSRRGTWIFGRLGPTGQPNEISTLSRASFFMLTKFQSLLNNLYMKRCNKKVDHIKYGINPKVAPTSSVSTVNDQLPNMLQTGAIKMKPDIKELHEHSVEFVDGTKIENVDFIVCGTGYLPEFPFLASDVIGEDKSNMYLGMFPPERKKQTLALIGCFHQKGPIIPVTEMQSRLATKIFRGLVKLPDRQSMWKSIRRNQEETQNSRISNKKGVTQIDFLPYMDELASMIGCKPNLLKLLVQDPCLAWECMFGPPTSYQYRLTGPGAWSGGRDAILNQRDRTNKSLNNGKGPAVEQKPSLKSLLMIAAVVTLGYAVFWP